MIKVSSLTEKLKLYCSLIKIEHTLFSLPFVLSSALLALSVSENTSLNIILLKILWMSLALLGARSAGMALNRIIDHKIDSKNIRTKDRELILDKLSMKTAWLLVLISLILYFYAALQLPRLCLILSPIPLIWIISYPYFKRFSFLSHLFLGTTLGGASLGGWIAITGTIDNLAPIYLALAVTFWVTGFDIIYATQDIDFDRSQGLHSVPQKFGFDAAVLITKILHSLTVLFLYLVSTAMPLGIIYKLGVLLVFMALIYEQNLVKLGKIETAFFTVNTWISVVIFIFVGLEILCR